MNGVRIVALVMALAVTAMVGTVTAQESAEPEQQKEVREIIVEIAGDSSRYPKTKSKRLAEP